MTFIAICSYDRWLNFNPHHPCGWWLFSHKFLLFNNLFQSTPPLWVVTFPTIDRCVFRFNFNPHHPCGWWLDFISSDFLILSNFNPHHPCGWWHYTLLLPYIVWKFQSTPPLWVVTKIPQVLKVELRDFNPHHPCGWWLQEQVSCYLPGRFQSTPPLWVVTLESAKDVLESANFNPHHPCGWWLADGVEVVLDKLFQSTPPLWVVTIYLHQLLNCCKISIHTTLVGGDAVKLM